MAYRLQSDLAPRQPCDQPELNLCQNMPKTKTALLQLLGPYILAEQIALPNSYINVKGHPWYPTYVIIGQIKRRYGGHILDQTWHLVPSCRFHLSILIPLLARRNNEQGRRWHVTVEGNSDLQPTNRFGSTPSETLGRSQFVSESVVHYNGYFFT